MLEQHPIRRELDQAGVGGGLAAFHPGTGPHSAADFQIGILRPSVVVRSQIHPLPMPRLGIARQPEEEAGTTGGEGDGAGAVPAEP